MSRDHRNSDRRCVTCDKPIPLSSGPECVSCALTDEPFICSICGEITPDWNAYRRKGLIYCGDHLSLAKDEKYWSESDYGPAGGVWS